MGNERAVLYHEPNIVTILIQSSFILALNTVDFVLDRAIYCGLVGQVLIGMVYGTPVADILGPDLQHAITTLGYLGLILIVFEGGLSTNWAALRSNLVISCIVALTGISLPIGMSFMLLKMCNATIVQAFAAGCALSSTSLGTAFTILKTSALDNSRLGVVLTSAAMLDDVVGLVLVQVISNLGSANGGSITVSVVVRPVFVSLAYAGIVPVILYLLKKRLFISCRLMASSRKFFTFLQSQRGAFTIYTLLLITAVTSAAYAGTSVLFAAYLAGLVISSVGNTNTGENMQAHSACPPKAQRPTKSSDSDAPRDGAEAWELVSPSNQADKSTPAEPAESSQNTSSDRCSEQRRLANENEENTTTKVRTTKIDGSRVYEKYFSVPVNRLLKPFFFASIGLSIPITRLFDGQTLWRGAVYALLMTFGKLACGMWLIRFSRPASQSSSEATGIIKLWESLLRYRPQSLYPAAMLGSAMVARGEIGFLISALAESNSIFEQAPNQANIYLVVTWAILLCTIVGPISVGLLTRRVKRLRRDTAQGSSGKQDPLGVWADI